MNHLALELTPSSWRLVQKQRWDLSSFWAAIEAIAQRLAAHRSRSMEDCKDGLADGLGQYSIEFKNGNKVQYTGQMKSGRSNGEGRSAFGGNVLTGRFADGRFEEGKISSAVDGRESSTEGCSSSWVSWYSVRSCLIRTPRALRRSIVEGATRLLSGLYGKNFGGDVFEITESHLPYKALLRNGRDTKLVRVIFNGWKTLLAPMVLSPVPI